MTEEISQRELRNDSGRVMRSVAEGRSFVVTTHGVPVAELTPIRRRRFVAAVDVAAVFAHAPVVDHRRLRADLDAAVDDTIEPRV